MDTMKVLFDGEDRVSSSISKVTSNLQSLKREYVGVRKAIRDISQVGRVAQSLGFSGGMVAGMADFGRVSQETKKQYSETAQAIGQGAGIVAGAASATLFAKVFDDIFSSLESSIDSFGNKGASNKGGAFVGGRGRGVVASAPRVAGKLPAGTYMSSGANPYGSMVYNTQKVKSSSTLTSNVVKKASTAKIAESAAKIGVGIAGRVAGSLVPVIGQIMLVATAVELVSQGAMELVYQFEKTFSPTYGGRSYESMRQAVIDNAKSKTKEAKPFSLQEASIRRNKYGQLTVNGKDKYALFGQMDPLGPNKRYGGNNFLSQILYESRRDQFFKELNDEYRIRKAEATGDWGVSAKDTMTLSYLEQQALKRTISRMNRE